MIKFAYLYFSVWARLSAEFHWGGGVGGSGALHVSQVSAETAVHQEVLAQDHPKCKPLATILTVLSAGAIRQIYMQAPVAGWN